MIFFGSIAAGYGFLVARINSVEEEGILALRHARAVCDEQQTRVASAVEARREENTAMERLRRTVVASVAVIGEAYKPLREHFGDVPTISTPLRNAKELISREQYDVAMAEAHTAWQSVKEFRTKIAGLPPGYYAVRRGDTLWDIAARHSPVHRGAGWVAIWKANHDAIPDFDRIETGMNLNIPQERSRYETPFWKPAAK